MDIGGLLTSAAFNIGICLLLLSLYSILRKQPSNRVVYFGRRLASMRFPQQDFDRFVPSPRWMLRAWQVSEEEILAIGGMDAVVFQRILVFSIRVFSIAAVICMFLVLPVNYHGQEMQHNPISNESLDVFSIGNVKEGSKWFWAHCLALYVISLSACGLLYLEYKSITKMRLAHIASSPLKPSNFTILVRSIPSVPGESYSESVRKFFSRYCPSSYLSHQMVYHRGIIQKLMADAERMCKMLTSVPFDKSTLTKCCVCGATTSSFKMLSDESVSDKCMSTSGLDLQAQSSFKMLSNESVNDKCMSANGLDLQAQENECSAAFVFFKTRYAAVVTTQVLQSSNPMLWATELAPEPHDVLWSNLSIPYKQLWFRRIATLLAAIVFMFLFLVPVALVQGLTKWDRLARKHPCLRKILKNHFVKLVVTGYLPSVILMLFLYTVPPLMMLFSSVEGPVSRSKRKKSACLKILYFTIWNVFFVNVFSGSVIDFSTAFSTTFSTSVKDIPVVLAKAIPSQASFFMTYVLTSGWASLACEVMQLFPFLCNLFRKFILRDKKNSSDGLLSFPYHTEVPRILLFGLLGFTCSTMAPLILPLLLIYFLLAYLVYQNQILNVYVQKYESGGMLWPVAHNTTIFSLVLAQIIAIGVFGIKRSPVASGFTVPLVIFTLLFNQYCRQRFLPLFKKEAAQILIDMDREDEECGRMEEIYQQLRSAYCQIPFTPHEFCNHVHTHQKDPDSSIQDPEAHKPGLIQPTKGKDFQSGIEL